MPIVVLSEEGAARRGFPDDPRPGERRIDPVSGEVFTWFEEENGLGDLGFWGALVGLGSSLLGGLFGGGKSKQQLEQAKQTIEQQQKLIEKQEGKIERQEKDLSRAILTKGDIKSYGPTLAIIALGAWYLWKK